MNILMGMSTYTLNLIRRTISLPNAVLHLLGQQNKSVVRRLLPERNGRLRV